jgi:hypothetical protein
LLETKGESSQVSVLLKDAAQAATDAAAAAPHPTAATTPQRETVGTALGDAGSRAGPLPHPSAAVPAAVPVAVPAAAPEVAPASVPVAGSTPVVKTTAAAFKRILAVAAAEKTFAFVQPNPKTGKSRDRCEVYMVDTTFSGLEALKGANFPGKTRPVFRGGEMILSGDFANDVGHGFVTFVEATASPTVALSVSVVRAASVTRAAPARSFCVEPMNRVKNSNSN